MRSALSLLIGLTVLAPRVPGAGEQPFGLDENHPYGRLTADYVTPHVVWARPYCKGATQVLVVAPTWSQRETVELAQRVSLEFTPWMSASFDRFVAKPEADPAFSFFQAPPEVMQRAGAAALKKTYDVIIIGKLTWAAIPGRERFELLRKVAEDGTGLLYVNPPKGDPELDLVFSRAPAPDGAAWITAHLPLATLPRFQAVDRGNLVRTCQFGRGRVVVLDYQEPPLPNTNAWESCSWPCLSPQWDQTDPKDGYRPPDTLPEAEFVPYDYYLALVARAVLWAGRKEPEVRMEQIDLPASLVWPVVRKECTVRLAGPLRGAVVRACVRSRRDGHAIDLAEHRAAAAVRLQLPDLPAGNYFLDVWVLASDNRATLTWGSQAFSVTADSPLGELRLAQVVHNVGDPVRGTLALGRPLQPEETVILSLWDNWGRLVESTAATPRDTRIEFQFAPLLPLATLYRVEAQLWRQAQPVCSTDLSFPVRARAGWDDFNEVVWSGSGNNVLTHLMLRRLANADETTAIDVGWRGNTDARNVALANLASVPYTARYGCLGAGPDHIVPANADNAYGCMSSPVTLANLDKWGATQSAMYGPYGPMAWTHGDETNYSAGDPDLCWSPTCLTAFRAFLQGVYPDLDALNREWHTTFTNWAEAMPLTYEEARESKAYARWIEHRLSANQVFAAFYRRSGEALSKFDPGARAGFDGGVGLVNPNSGGDWWTLSRNIAILHSYIGASADMEMFRSFARPEQVRGMWYGTYGLTWQIGPNTPGFCHFFPWYSLFHQLNTTWFWTMGAPGPLSGYAPDLTPLPFFAARTEALHRIRSGIGKLLLHSVREHDGIAVHHSEASRVADSLFSANGTAVSAAYADAVTDVNKALEDSGLQYQYVASRQIIAGELARGAFRVLIMPHSRAVAEAEAARIREFVHAGGLVVADLRPGTLNSHGTPQPDSVLADLFPSDQPETVTRAGRGRAILIGDLLAGYAKAHMAMAGWKKVPLEGSRRLAALLQEHAGVAAQVRVVPRGLGPMPPTEISRFRDPSGGGQFVGLLREYFLYDNGAYPVTIQFPAKANLYDVMAGSYLGCTDRIEATVSFQAQLYALLPYRVESLRVTVPSSAKVGQRMPVQVAVKPTPDARVAGHVLRLELTGPDGRPAPAYAMNLLAPDGTVTVDIPWALNDLPGKWTLSVRDAATGVSVSRTLNLK